MAVRKLRKKMKPVIWTITIAFFLSMILVGYSSLKSTMNQDVAAFKLNGTKVKMQEVELGINSTTSQYSQYLGDNLSKDLISVLAIDNLISEKLTLDIAKKLKVKISRSDVNAEYKRIEDSIGDKAQFSRMLQAQGYNTTTLKEEIKEGMTIQETVKKITENIEVTSEEVSKEYEENKFGQYYGKTFAEVQEEIKESLKTTKSNEEYMNLINVERKAMEITNVASNYETYMETVEVEKDGFKFTNVDIAKRNFKSLFMTQGDLEQAEIITLENIESDVKIANIAIEKGVSVDKEAEVEDQISELREGLTNKLKSDYSFTEADLEAYFETRRTAYDTAKSISADIATFKVIKSEEDEKVAELQANVLLKELTPENFAEMAITHSQGPSGPNGGDLGWFGKGQMVAEFEAAAFEGEAGAIYPEVVKTQFGYHIIYVEEKTEDKVKASHILIKNEASDKTKQTVLTEANDVAAKLNSNELNFEDLAQGESIEVAKTYEGIREGGYIQGLGYATELSSEIFEGSIDKAEATNVDGTVYVFIKRSQIDFKAADFNEMKEKVEYDFLSEKSREELSKITL